MANRDEAVMMVLHDASASADEQPARECEAREAIDAHEVARESQVHATAIVETLDSVAPNTHRERPTLIGLAQVTETLGLDAGHADAAQDDARAQPEAETPGAVEVGLALAPESSPSSALVHASLQEDGDAEWLDLSTRWLIASKQTRTQRSEDAEAPPAPHWADSLAAQIKPAPETRGSAPPPPPPARTAPQRSLRETWNHPARRAVPRHSTLSGLQPLAELPTAGPAKPLTSEPDPWREEHSDADGHRAEPAPPAHPYASAAGLPPWAAGFPAYPPPPWSAAVQPYAAAPWIAPPMPPGALGAARPASGFEHWTSVGNAWLTAVAKFAFAAMALHYSGVAEPVLAHFGYAHASAATTAAPSSSVAMARAPASETLPPSSPAAPIQTAVQAPARLPEPNARPASEPRRAASAPASRHAAAEHQAKPREKPTLTPPRPAAAVAASASSQAEDDALGEATLRINSRPWSQVFVDGTLVGHTPKLDLRVSAGSHRIRLVNPDLQLSKVVELHAAAGETISRVEQLSR